MKNVLFDTNIILDIALQREQFFNDAVALFDLIDKNEVAAYVTATTITDIYYISKKEKGHSRSIEFIKNLVEVVGIVAINQKVVISALDTVLKDFEDSIQLTASELNELDALITRNKQDFPNFSSVKVFTPGEFLSSI